MCLLSREIAGGVLLEHEGHLESRDGCLLDEGFPRDAGGEDVPLQLVEVDEAAHATGEVAAVLC